MSHATGIYALLFSGLSRCEGAALGVSVGEQQSHYCATEQNKTDRAHGSSPSRMLCDCSRYLGSQSRILTALAELKSVPVEHAEFDRIENRGGGV